MILPAALYRQQVTNVNFPQVSGKVTQVSPLLEKLATRRYNYGYEVLDNLVGHATLLETVPTEEGYGYGIYLFDTQPVITGAAYQYFLVRFKANHEVDQIIPAGTVTIP